MSFTGRSSKSHSKSKSKTSSRSAAQQQSLDLPPSLLATELLMMQFMGGGSLERHAKRMMEQQAQGRDIPASAGHRSAYPSDRHGRRRRKSSSVPLSETHRDPDERGNGNMWWGRGRDSHESTEFRGLLTPQYEQSQSQGWVPYDPFAATSPISTTFFASSEISDIPWHSYVTPNPFPARPDVSSYPSYSPVPVPQTHTLLHGDVSAGEMGMTTMMMKKKKTGGMNLRGRARALFGRA
jgi:hypothetical protein